jgi:hypothetical protein
MKVSYALYFKNLFPAEAHITTITYMKNDKVIYSLTIGDIQTVAQENYGRKLTDQELQILLNSDTIGERINWFDVIDAAIQDKLNLTTLTKSL